MSETIARLDWRTFLKASDDTPEATIKALDNHFSHFAAVEIKDGDIQPQKCVGCEAVLTGIFGSWRWGIAHGDGQCGNCGWPSVGHHFIKDENGEDLITLRHFILQVHPDFVERRKRA